MGFKPINVQYYYIMHDILLHYAFITGIRTDTGLNNFTYGLLCT